jgi:hypothetical protein
MLCAFLITHTRATCPTHLTLIDLFYWYPVSSTHQAVFSVLLLAATLRPKHSHNKPHTVHTVHCHSFTQFLNQQIHNFYLLHNTIFFTVKSVQHVSDPYSGTIIRDPFRESDEITNQQILENVPLFADLWFFVIHNTGVPLLLYGTCTIICWFVISCDSRYGCTIIIIWYMYHYSLICDFVWLTIRVYHYYYMVHVPLFVDLWFRLIHDTGPWWWSQNRDPKHVGLILL